MSLTLNMVEEKDYWDRLNQLSNVKCFLSFSSPPLDTPLYFFTGTFVTGTMESSNKGFVVFRYKPNETPITSIIPTHLFTKLEHEGGWRNLSRDPSIGCWEYEVDPFLTAEIDYRYLTHFHWIEKMSDRIAESFDKYHLSISCEFPLGKPEYITLNLYPKADPTYHLTSCVYPSFSLEWPFGLDEKEIFNTLLISLDKALEQGYDWPTEIIQKIQES